MKTGFIFDLDGVLTDTATYHYLAWRALGAQLGIAIDETFNASLKGLSRMDSLERLLRQGNQTQAFSQAEKKQLAEQKNAHYLTLLADLSSKDLLPGAMDFLQQAAAHQIPCALASASQNAPMILEKLNIQHFFAHIVDPTTLKHNKPEPEIFLKAASLLAIAPEHAVGFEDAQAGITALKRAKIYAVGISASERLQGADLQVATLAELSADRFL